LDQIDNQQKKQYLLLHSLKEVCAHELPFYLLELDIFLYNVFISLNGIL